MVIYTNTAKSPRDVVSLYEALGWAQYLQVTTEQLDEAMQNSWSALYAYEGDALVGTARLISDGVINAYLCGVGVHPDHRGQGIGNELVRQVVELCEAQRLHLQLMCEADLVPMYENLGFRIFAQGMRTGYGVPK